MKASLLVLAASTLLTQVAAASVVQFNCYVRREPFIVGESAPRSGSFTVCREKGLEKLAQVGCEVDAVPADETLHLSVPFYVYRISVQSSNCSSGTRDADTAAEVVSVQPDCAEGFAPYPVPHDQDPAGPIFARVTNHVCKRAR